ncbi:MAG: tetratricopeptide repeat protein, partial [Pseudomonadota bacterium]
MNFIILITFAGCSGISFIQQGPKKDLYSDAFLKQIEQVKKLYRQGEVATALKNLQRIDDKTVTTPEQGMKYNLLGVIQFGQKEYQKAIATFDQALNLSSEDPNLSGQVRLNLSSCYFKLSFWDKAYQVLKPVEVRSLTSEEANKYYKLRFRLAKELGKEAEELDTVAQILTAKTNLLEVRGDPYFEILSNGFYKLPDTEKTRFIEKFSDPPVFAVGYLAYFQVEKIYYQGDREKARDLLNWLKSKFSSFEQIKSFVDNFSFRMENFAKMDTRSIGVVLPLSGDKKNFGERTLLGVD